MDKLDIHDRVKNKNSNLDFSVLKKLCEEYDVFPRRVILRKPTAKELETPKQNTGYYTNGYLVFVIYEQKYTKGYFDYMQAHEYRHVLQSKIKILRNFFRSDRADTVRKMLLAILATGTIAQELLGVDEENIHYYDPCELDADIFAYTYTGCGEPNRVFEKRPARKQHDQKDTPSCSGDKPC